MSNKTDTTKVEIISDEVSVKKNDQNIIVIEQKSKPESTKPFYESTIFLTLIVPIIIVTVNFIIARWWFNKKEKKETEKLSGEISKMKSEEIKIQSEITQIKSSFQPIVLGTIQKTQEVLLEDKIEALKQIVTYRSKIFTVNNIYVGGESMIQDEYDFYSNIYNGLCKHDIESYNQIVSSKGYIFPNKIKDDLNTILKNLNSVYDLYDYQYSLGDQSMPVEGETLLKEVKTLFNVVIDNIRHDLHIDDTFIHDFIEKYKKLN